MLQDFSGFTIDLLSYSNTYLVIDTLLSNRNVEFIAIQLSIFVHRFRGATENNK